MKRKERLGSETAKGGFRNEDDIVSKFNDWKGDKEARNWLVIMGYALKDIESVNAVKIRRNYKTDVQVQVTIETKEEISVENLSVKLVSNSQGYNQVDKRWVDDYKKLWKMPDDIASSLKRFTGETKPHKRTRDHRRMFFDEMKEEAQEKMVSFFEENRIQVVADILMGRGQFAARWMLVALVLETGQRWILRSINEAMDVFGKGIVAITERGSLKIGRITVQRKGGDAGRSTANMLQFKVNPCDLFRNQKGE